MSKVVEGDRIKLLPFSLDTFVENGITRGDVISLTMYIEEHGDSFYLYHKGDESVYKVPKTSVNILSEAYSVSKAAISRTHYRIEVDRNAPCVRMSSGKAGQLLGKFLRTEPDPLILTLQVKVAFTGNGEGTLTFGSRKVACLGNPTTKYPKDLTVQNIEGIQYQGDYANAYKFRIWISSEFGNAEMPWAVKIWGQRGIFIHEGADNIPDNDGDPSAGCIHLAAPNAKDFYDWITGPTRIQISYPW